MLRAPNVGQLATLVAFGVLNAQCLLASATSLTGSVVDDGGHAVPGARVLISYAPAIKPPSSAPPVITGPLAGTAVTDSAGAFRADNLPPGQYIACAEALGYLDPCHWSTTAPSFALSAGQLISGVKIVMAKGAILQMHVDDPQQLLAPVTGPVDLNLQIHIVTAKGLHYSAPIQSITATSRDHVITIPFDTAVNLRVLSAHFAVNDQAGAALSAAGTTVSTPSGMTPGLIVFTVTGKK